MTESFTLPDVRLLRSKRTAKEREDFLRAVLSRLERNESSYAGASASLVTELVLLLPPTPHATETLRQIAQRSASLGLAVADEEQARGWARDGRVDAVVQSALEWDLRRGATEAYDDWIAGTLAAYVLNAGYYLARQGDGG